MGRCTFEFAREREALKYDGSFQTTTDRLSTPLRSAKDSVLTSFAQLTAFRIGASRALVSLFDRQNQYVVAEATPALSLQPGVPHDDLWLCGTAIPRSEGICESVLIGRSEDGQAIVVPDLANDTRFQERSCVSQGPSSRFYAGVPLCTPKGINIGVLSVFDDKPRDGLDPASVQHMCDMSRTVMNYLESRRLNSRGPRNELMVRGLCSFVQGKTSISGDQRNGDGFGSELHEEDAISYVKRQEASLTLNQYIANQANTPSLFMSHVPSGSTTTGTSTPTNTDAFGAPKLLTNSHLDLSASTLSPVPATPSYITKNTQDDVHQSGIKRVFSKAATIIREAVEADEVLFVDASVRSFGGLVGEQRSRTSSQTSYQATSCDEDTTIDLDDIGGEYCNVFGFASRRRSSKDGHPPSALQTSIPERFLRSLLRHYPQGHVFNFDNDGTVALGEDSADEDEASPSANSDGRPDIKSQRRRSFRLSPRDELAILSSLFPNTQSLALVPLWDASRERFSGCGFIFNYPGSRYFTVQGDLSFLRAFGMSIQGEIDRVEALFSEKAKSDMLGSLSHELRSPLHGLLGACELIHDTNMTVFQRDMIHMAETSGRTLLDVIDHLLDYSKINTVRRDLKRNGVSRSRTGYARRQHSNDPRGMIQQTDIDLDLLTEEVVESVFTGHDFQRASVAQLASQQESNATNASLLKQPDAHKAIEKLTQLQLSGKPDSTRVGAVSVYLDVDPDVSWRMVGVPGALRRIIMNIFGNALKFTEKGFVYVGLHLESTMAGARRRKHIVLNVIDSGKGISDDFLQNKIFKPFSQEDQLSPGTGLGLNIVHQITNTLGGYIRVHSQVGQGTQFSVFLPHSHIPDLEPREEPFVSQVNSLAGLRVRLAGFEKSFPGPFMPSVCGDEQTLLARICRDWLKMEIVPGAMDNNVLPEIIIVTDEALDEVIAAQPRTKPLPPVVVVCQNAIVAHSLSSKAKVSERQLPVQFISQPAGPRKLAQALVFSFTRWKEAQKGPTRPTSVRSDSVASELTSADATPWDEFPTPFNMESSPSPLSETSSPLDTAGAKIPTPPVESLPLKNIVAEKFIPEDLKTPVQEEIKPTPEFLVVDDNKINVQILSSFLKKLKVHHETASDGLEALETYTSHPGHFEYIFMDISMPRMDGLEATRRIRAFEQERQLGPAKIIALTGLASSEMQKEAFASGVDLFLTKPVRLKELTDIIAKKKSVEVDN